jgi:integrase
VSVSPCVCVHVCVSGTVSAAAAQGNQGDKKKAAEARRRAAEAFIGENRNKNTALTYAGGWKRFQAYLDRAGVAVVEVTEVEVAAFLQERWQTDGVKSSTLQADKAAIADGLKGYKNGAAAGRLVVEMMAVLAARAEPPTPKRHMSLELMRSILQALKQEGDVDLANANPPAIRRAQLASRNYCLLLFMLLGMLRASEAVGLADGDVLVETVGGGKTLSLFIRRSKGDQERKGEEVRLGENKADSLACPVEAYTRYQALKAAHRLGAPEEPLFCQLGGEPLAAATPNHIVQNAVEEANIRWQRTTGEAQHFGAHEEYGSHSMRRGGVTLARDSGVSMLDIQRHGRWKSLLVFDYVGRTLEQQLAVTATLMSAGRGGRAPVRQDSDCMLVESRGDGDKLGKAAGTGAAAGGAGTKVSRGVSRKRPLTMEEEEDEEDLDSDVCVPKHTSSSATKLKGKPRGPRGPYGPRKRKEAPASAPRAAKKARLALSITPAPRSAPAKRATAAAATASDTETTPRTRRRLELPRSTEFLSSGMLTQRG